MIPESKAILTCTNLGTPVITLGDKDRAACAYKDMVDRFSGDENVEWRYTTAEPCAMCMSAIAWSGFARVLYGTSIPYFSSNGA